MATAKRFAPYPTSDRISLALAAFDDPAKPGEVDFDNVQRTSEFDPSGDLPVYDVSEKKWDKLSFQLTAELATPELDRILGDSGTAEDLQMIVTIVCKATKFRHGVVLLKSGEGRWVGDAALARNDVRGTVQVNPILVRSTSVPGTGQQRGTMLATGETVAIYIDPPHRMIEGALEVRWDDFAQSGNDWRKTHPSDVFHLEPYGDAPVLYLNDGHVQMRQLLDNDSKRGADAALRDVTAALIAQTVWTQLAVIALASIDHDPESGNAELPPGGWQRDLLLAFLPRMYPGVADDLQARRAAADLDSVDGISGLMARVGSAVQDLVRTSKHVESAIRAYDSMRMDFEEARV
jgi:hypothetical protein